MTRPRVRVARRLAPAVEARIARIFDAVIDGDDAAFAPDAWIDSLEGCIGAIIAVTERHDAALISRLPASVKIIATHSVGTDHIDLAAAKARGLVIANTPGALTEATADVALLCMLGAARRATEARSLLDAGWGGWRPTQLMGRELAGARCGVLGMGRIGRAFARRARACGMEIHYCNRSRLAPAEEEGAVFHATADSLFAVADVLSLHAPASPETRRMLDAAAIARLPEGAIVVNTARGELIDDDALIAALSSGRIAAAGLDVFTGEPALDPRYLALPNVYPLPHIGSATVATRTAMGMLAVDAVEACAAGRKVPNQVV